MKQSYTYNAANLITKITTAKGSSNLKQETYSYYADGNRSSYTSFAGNTVTTAYDALGRLTNEHSTGANAYDKTYTYDARGNRAKLIVAGGETVTYAYDAFGVELSPVSSDANPFRYSGEYFDAETGDYYLRARYYAPGLGRFLSEDPVRDGDNWYVYCNNNPVRYVDPSGKIAVVDDALITLVLVIGAIVTVTAEWLASPEGQKALNNGAKVIHEAVETVVEGARAGIEAAKEFVGDVVDAVSNWIFGVSDEENEGDTNSQSNNNKDKARNSNVPTPSGQTTQQAPDDVDTTPSSNHSTTKKDPGIKGEPNSSVDILDKYGKIATRRWYDSNGKAYRDVDMTNHGNPKTHTKVPHAHTWDWSDGIPKRN